MTLYNPAAVLLFNSQAAGLPGTITASGNSGSATIRLADAIDVALQVAVAGVTGTTPSMVVGLDLQDVFGNWSAQVIKTSAITAAGVVAPVSGGLHSSGLVLPLTGRISWTVTGTTPSFTGVTISLIGR